MTVYKHSSMLGIIKLDMSRTWSPRKMWGYQWVNNSRNSKYIQYNGIVHRIVSGSLMLNAKMNNFSAISWRD